MPNPRYVPAWCCLWLTLISGASAEEAGRIAIPRHQSAPPGPPLSPAEAIAKMDVPDGFSVELVAAEPDVVNPVAMTIDERGRFWITESFEYPRRSPGPGRDRIKILEDTDHDGQVDKVTVFATGLNIPSGIAVGHGGVWVANAPDILYLQDTDGDGHADRQEVVVTGFGRTDTHELPNSLTWGPDGWLYGLNGVFNRSHVTHQGRDYEFTCAMFRIHPRTREFQLFAEGTSNPWGIAFDEDGSAFVSACVIDHLWHLTETGYYHRQGGPYPPHTWKLGSIVKHSHQMAAYCGITCFDSESYPADYRGQLFMGNIHGGCINVDRLARDGSTYVATPAPDFLTANDAWFMPVVQKTGPDGCLYILDWYDRYHCYQDANRDPAGLDRGRGRLYRVRYGDTPRAPTFDLAQETDDQLLGRLKHSNVYYRDVARRLLAERLLDQHAEPATWQKLQRLVLDNTVARKTRLTALWVLISGGSWDEDFHLEMLRHDDATFRAWAVRAAANQPQVSNRVLARVVELAEDGHPDVRLQVAIAARKLAECDSLDVLCDVLAFPQADKLIPHIVWQNLLPIWDERREDFVERVAEIEQPSDNFARLMPQAVNRLLDAPDSTDSLARLLTVVLAGDRWATRNQCLHQVHDVLLNDSVWAGRRAELGTSLLPVLRAEFTSPETPDRDTCLLLATLLGDTRALEQVRSWLVPRETRGAQRASAAFHALAAMGDGHVLPAATTLLAQNEALDPEFVTNVVAALARLDDPEVASLLLRQFDSLPDVVQPRIVELLTQRREWSRQLLNAVATQRVPRETLHVNQVRRLQASADPEIVAQVHQIWGTVRAGRNPQVEESIEEIRGLIKLTEGSAARGHEVFRKTCGQCHQIYGQGEQVGPDITRNGRSTFDQLLSNVFDPNLVIGPAYQAHLVTTTDGRSLSGLLVLDTPERIVLKLQGGKEETLPRDQLEQIEVSSLSLMPEGWEKQLSRQELVDLIHFLTLDGPPDSPQAKRLPGTPPLLSADVAP